MATILVLYGTTDGHTRTIAEHVAALCRDRGHFPILQDTATLPSTFDFSEYDAYLVAGSVHQGKHQASLTHAVKLHARQLSEKPSAFLSIGLSAILKDEEHVANCHRYIEDFLHETGWRSNQVLPVAGALLYTQYDWMKRTLMKLISKKEGGDDDTSRDHVYTDWNELDHFVVEFLHRVDAERTVLI